MSTPESNTGAQQRPRNIYLDDETYNLLRDYAAERRLSVSAAFRQLVLDRLGAAPAAPEPRQPTPRNPTVPPRTEAATRKDAGAQAGARNIVLPNDAQETFPVKDGKVRTRKPRRDEEEIDL